MTSPVDEAPGEPPFRVGATQPASSDGPLFRKAKLDWVQPEWDVIVIGGGNAAAASAMAADDLGMRVLVLERAPRHMRGGNTRHTRNIRCVHAEVQFNTGIYTFDEMWADLCGVGDGPNDKELAEFTVRDSETIPDWMYAHGARWQKPLAGTLHLGRTNRFFLGGGKALLNSYYRYLASRPRVSVVYDAKVDELVMDGSRCAALVVGFGGQRVLVRGKAVVCASGGFEANLEWLRRYWSDAVDNFIIRGTPYNDGHILERLFAANAARVGEEKGFHAIALDARSPKFDSGIATRLDTIPFGVAVNKFGERFYDEGEDFWPKRYAIWGRQIAEQPSQIAMSIWDAKVSRLFLPPMYGVTRADSISELADRLGIEPAALERSICRYNCAVQPGTFNPAVLDDCATAGIEPPKTHWAQRIDQPPYFGVRMRPGVSFTYMGVAVNRDARVRLNDGGTFANVFAAGEIMSGNILSNAYLAGLGMTIGSVWGRQAGRKAAELVSG